MDGTAPDLAERNCVPCKGGEGRLSLAAAEGLLAGVPGWRLSALGDRIRRDWRVRNFLAGMAFLRAAAELAEAQNHHPDLHLVDYRHLWVEVWTHDVGGLSENDFILAAKLNRLPIDGKDWPTD